MFRYLDLMVDEFGRMRRAMAARATTRSGFGRAARWRRQQAHCSSAPMSAASGSTTPWRQGFTGTMPTLSEGRTTRNDWLLAAIPAVVSVAGLTIVGLT